MNYHKIDEFSTTNGHGARVVLWVSGCRVKCPGCHNPEAWDLNSGHVFDEEAKAKLFYWLSMTFIQGLTLSGGNPLEYENLPDVYDLIKEVKEKYPDKDVWLYAGYTLDVNDFDNTVDIGWNNGLLRNYILAMCDVVVDGEYVADKRDISSTPFRGSTNQRLIDVKKTKEEGRIVTWKK